MASTVSGADMRTLVNPLRGRLDDLHPRSAKARIDAKPVELSEVLPLLDRAASETGLMRKAMASNAGIPESVLSDAFSGRRHFSSAWWWAQPDGFLIRFLELVMEARQLTPESVTAIRRQRIVELVDLLLRECA